MGILDDAMGEVNALRAGKAAMQAQNDVVASHNRATLDELSSDFARIAIANRFPDLPVRGGVAKRGWLVEYPFHSFEYPTYQYVIYPDGRWDYGYLSSHKLPFGKPFKVIQITEMVNPYIPPAKDLVECFTKTIQELAGA